MDTDTAHPEKPPQPDRPPAVGDAGKAEPEVGGPSGPEPTRYGDWEVGGRCVDF